MYTKKNGTFLKILLIGTIVAVRFSFSGRNVHFLDLFMSFLVFSYYFLKDAFGRIIYD
jgi:purine-cytosine permease-like protein